MHFDPDDPKLTAFALGELDDVTRAQVEAAIALDPNAARLVDEIRAIAAALEVELAREQTAGLGDERREALIAQSEKLLADAFDPDPAEGHPGKTPLYHVLTHPAHQRRELHRPLAIAGVAAALLVGLASIAALLTNPPRAPVAQTQPTPSREIIPFVIFPGSQGVGGDTLALTPSPNTSPRDVANDASDEMAFTDTNAHPVSGFPMAVSTASYGSVQRSIAAGHLPSPASVRIEEMVNAFAYRYAAPTGSDAFAADIETAACPWDAAHRLVRIGVQARQSPGGTVDPIANDVTASVEFNPATAARYRLIGYEHHAGPNGVGGSAVTSGQTVTALYEVVPAVAPTTAPAASPPLLLALTLRYRLPSAADAMTQHFTAPDAFRALPEASPDFRFAAAVASFGLALRSPTADPRTDFDNALSLATAARGPDADGSRAAFADLVRKARELRRA